MRPPRQRTGYCKQHPTYRAERAPTADCPSCRKAWAKKVAFAEKFSQTVKSLMRKFPKATRIELCVRDVEERLAVVTPKP
jgi:hypothetical protein